MDKIHPFAVFKHYEGKDYLMLGNANHFETNEEIVIIQVLYDDYQVLILPYEMFYGSVELDGVKVPRFKSIVSDRLFDQIG